MNGVTDSQHVAEALAEEVARQAKAVAREFLLNLYAVVRVGRFHTMDNDAAQQALDRAMGTMEGLFELHDTVEVLYYSRDFYVNEHRIKATETTFELFETFSEELQRRWIGSLRFNGMPERKSLEAFTEIFLKYTGYDEEEEGDTFDDISQALERRGVTDIELTKFVPHDLEKLPSIDKRTFVKLSYFRCIRVVRELYQQAREGRPITFKAVRRIVQNFVDVYEDPNHEITDLLLLLTGVKNWEGYLYCHAVNTSILAVGLGRALGMKRHDCRDLGVAAALVDIGNVSVDLAYLDGADALDEEGWEAIYEHPFRGVSVLGRYQELDPVLVRSVNASLTHHKWYDGGGYPAKLKTKRNLFSEIIAVCDRYDAMTTPRPWRPRAMTPAEALEWLARASGRELNPLVVKAFVQWIGSVPSGSLVLLEGGQIGIVLGAASRLRKRDQMRIKVILERDRSPAGGEVVEVAMDDTSSPYACVGVVAPPRDRLAEIGLAGLAE